MATKKRTTSATAWKKASQATALDVPSGNTCKARRVGLDTFIKKGLIPNSLMPIVQEAMKGKKTEMDLESVSEEDLIQIMELIDAVTVDVVVEPRVHPVPESVEDRDDGILYVDEVVMEDKMFIFQWTVGGSSDLERFREEQADAVGDLRGSEDVGSAAQ